MSVTVVAPPAKVASSFDPVDADAVEIVGLAANDTNYSRIVELEVGGAG